MTHITPERMDELWQQAFDDTHEGGTISHRFAALLFAEPAPTVQEAMAAIDTLKFLGYTYHGGEKWKPPLGAAPVQPDRTGMTYYRNDACTAKDAHAPDCICWTPAQPAVPDAITDNSEHPEYRSGWNAYYRSEMLKGRMP
jgi:hypothetical protein